MYAIRSYYVRAKLARGETVTNLTIGDFRPDQFPIPEMLKREVVAAIEDDQTNYSYNFV